MQRDLTDEQEARLNAAIKIEREEFSRKSRKRKATKGKCYIFLGCGCGDKLTRVYDGLKLSALPRKINNGNGTALHGWTYNRNCLLNGADMQVVPCVTDCPWCGKCRDYMHVIGVLWGHDTVKIKAMASALKKRP